MVESNQWKDVQTALSVIGGVGGLCGLWSLWYSRRQVVLMEQEIRKEDDLSKDELAWSERFERLANSLCRISPGLTIQEPGKNSTMCLYGAIFSDPKFREALENYVVQVNPGRTQFAQRNPRPDELRRSNFRQTIDRAEQHLREFQKEYPNISLKYYMDFDV